VTALDRISHFERDLVVQAGAGTGKTHALVTLYLHLVGGVTAAKRRTPPSKIAVVTFTDKAAGELKERLRGRLSSLVAHPRGEETLVAAARQLGVALPDGAHWLATLAQLGAAPVGTFHSFAGSLLRRHAAAAGVDPDFTLLDESEAAALAIEAAERAVLDALEASSAEAAELVAEYGYRGVGRAARLVEHLVRLRAARAEEGRTAEGLDAAYTRARLDDDWAQARAALTAAVDALDRVELGNTSADRAREICATLRAVELLPGCAARVTETLALLGRLRGSKGELDAPKAALRAAAERLVEAEAGQRAAPLASALAALLGATERGYVASKRRAGVLDFTDLLVLARNLLRDDATVREATRARFDAVLVDEFQDTNPVQAELVELTAGAPGERGRRFVVGDRKQSIYEFRGADVGVFTRAAADLLARGGREELLRESRRSAPAVLRFNNALFARAMKARGVAADWALSFEPGRDDLEPFRDELDGAGAELLTVGAQGEKLDAATARQREARAIAARIALLRAGGRAWGEIAILLRRFTALGQYLEALRVAQIPHYVVRGRGFWAAQEVRDLAAALALVDDPDDTLALVTVLRSPVVGVSDETLAQLALGRKLRAGALLGDDPLENLSVDERARLLDFRARFRALRRTADRLGPAACVRAVIDGADLAAVLATTREGEQRVANLERLVERARAFEDGGGDLRAFVAWLKRVGDSDDAAMAQVVDERDDVVRVMTVHQAKGLEFPVVLVPACGGREPIESGAIRYDTDEGLGLRVQGGGHPPGWVHTPASRRVNDMRAARRAAESLRLFYVAATRARDLVIFSGERVRGGADSWRAHLEVVARELPELIRTVDGDALPPPPRKKGGVQFSLFGDAGAEKVLQHVAERPAPRTRSLTCAVTQLADFELCPRRYLQFHALGLAEHPAAARAASAEGDDPTLDPLRRGTLAHRLLERAPFGEEADLDALLRTEGYDPDEPAVAEVRSHVTRFLETAFARGLAGRALRRELPFLYAVPLPDGGHLYVKGQIDLVVLDPTGVTVIDYKHARAPSDNDGDDDYRFQLEAYALAARRLYPRAPSVSAGLAFLKEADPSPRIALREAPAELDARLGRLGAELAAARAADEWRGLPLADCRALRCGYIYRCHGEAR
jgi:ATP-dependent exoDNAse (exonuclease V) beta subunit